MTDTANIARLTIPARSWSRWERVALPLTMFALTQGLAAVMISHASALQLPHAAWPAGAHVSAGAQEDEGYWAVVTNWDGQWYRDIAIDGYPRSLPVRADGHVAQNPWAFYPLYPALVRLIMMIAFTDFAHAAVIVSLLSGAVAMVAIYRFFSLTASRRAARIAVLGMCATPLTPVFQIAYTESVALLLLTVLLISLVRKHYLLSSGWILLLSLTRPTGPPLAVAMAMWGVVQVWKSRDYGPALPHLLLTLVATGSSFLWPAVAALITGIPNAYLVTQRAWNPAAGTPGPIQFLDSTSLPGGAVAAIVCVAAIVALFLRIATWGQNHLLFKCWTASYVAYLLVAVNWNITAARYFLLAYPVFWPLVRRESHREAVIANAVLAIMTASFVVVEWLWVSHVLVVTPSSKYVP